jgi:hypothetical protein
MINIVEKWHFLMPGKHPRSIGAKLWADQTATPPLDEWVEDNLVTSYSKCKMPSATPHPTATKNKKSINPA